jgi:transcriptional regulator with XRE-family HTH domain
MRTPTWFDNELAELENDLEFLTEEMAFDFVNEIRGVMKKKDITQTDLANLIGKSRAYVSKVLNYSPNMTIRSLAMVALALDLRWTRPHLVKKDIVDCLDVKLISCDEYTMQTTVTVSSCKVTNNDAIYFSKAEYYPVEQKGQTDGKPKFGIAA